MKEKTTTYYNPHTPSKTTTVPGYPNPFDNDVCDCDERCKKCGKKKIPYPIRPIWNIDVGPI